MKDGKKAGTAIVLILLIVFFIILILLFIFSDVNKSIIIIGFISDIVALIGFILNSKEKMISIFIKSDISPTVTGEQFIWLKNDWYYEKYYETFVGRKTCVQFINNYYETETSYPKILMIHALGGVGKTALCRKVVEDLYNNQIFSNIIWVQPIKKSFNVDEDIIEINEQDNTFYGYSSFITHIYRKLQLKDTSITELNRKEEILQDLFNRYTFLIMVDGIENSIQIDPIINKIITILGSNTSLLISSRERSRSKFCKPYELENFSYEEAKIFCNHIASTRNDIRKSYDTLSNSQKDKLYEISSGNPLFLKVLLSHLGSLPYERILDKYLSPEEPVNLYTYLLDSSWELLRNSDELAIKILIFLSQRQSIPVNLLYKYRFVNETPSKIDKSLTQIMQHLFCKLSQKSPKDPQ